MEMENQLVMVGSAFFGFIFICILGKSISTPIQLTPKICKSRQRSSGGTRSVSPPANNAIIDLCKSPTMSIRITDVSSHSNALTPTATSNASKDDGCDGIIDLLGDEEDYTIDLLDDLVINEDDDDNELNGDNHSDTTDAMDESTESDDDVILTAETSECCAPLSKPQSSPQSLRSPPHKIISPSKTCECRSPGSNGNRESPAAPLTEKAATARISASSASITDPTPPAKNLMVPEAARQIPNTEIDEETLKRFQLKNFSIRLSKNQCLEAIQNQEKLNFLYYFKVVERNTLKSKGRPAGTVKPIIIRRQVLKNTHKLPVSNRRGSCMIKKHQKKIHQKNKQQQRSVVMVRKVLKHLPKSPAGSDVIKSSLSSSKP